MWEHVLVKTREKTKLLELEYLQNQRTFTIIFYNYEMREITFPYIFITFCEIIILEELESKVRIYSKMAQIFFIKHWKGKMTE